jgi:hypothetical protein
MPLTRIDMRSSMLEEMFASDVEDGDFLSITDVNDEQGIPKPVSKKIQVGELMKYIKRPAMNLTVIDVNHVLQLVLLETNTGERFNVSFEFIEDIGKYINKTWKWTKA